MNVGIISDIRSLNRGQWGNVFLNVASGLIVNAALAAIGLMIGAGDGTVPSYYWWVAGIFGAIAMIIFVVCGLWGSIDRLRSGKHPLSGTTVPHDQLLPAPRNR